MSEPKCLTCGAPWGVVVINGWQTYAPHCGACRGTTMLTSFVIDGGPVLAAPAVPQTRTIHHEEAAQLQRWFER